MEAKITVTELNSGKCFIKYQITAVDGVLYINKLGLVVDCPTDIDNVKEALKVIDLFKKKKWERKIKRVVLEETINV